MRGQTVGRLPLLFIASVVVLATLVASAWSQAPLDPQSLVGEWSGSWTNKHLPVNGRYSLTIEKVEGDKVYGQVYFTTPTGSRPTVQFKIGGTLDRNRLTVGSQNPTELLIEGNQMTGSSQGAPRANPWDITLTKTK